MKRTSFFSVAMLALALGTTFNAWSQGGAKWGLNGNSVSGTDFLGTTNNASLIFKTNGSEAARFLGNGNFGIGTFAPTEKLEVNGNIRAIGNLFANSVNVTGPAYVGDITANRLITNKITSTLGEVHIGDSSIIFNTNINWLAWSQMTYQGVEYKGFSIGKAFPQALGFGSITLGSFTKAGPLATDAIVIGRGISFLSPLTNNITNSLAVGFNSDVPTLFIGPSNGSSGSTGKVGLGTSAPLAKLHSVASEETGICTETSQLNPYGYNLKVVVDGLGVNLTKAIAIYNNKTNSEVFTVYGDGSVGMGTSPDPGNYRLAVCGAIRATRVKVDANWCDFVFADSYKLKPLSEVEKFIKTFKHLPDVTPGEVVEKEGLDIASMQAIHMQKIEEIMLYLIELKKENESLNARILALESKK